MYGFAAVLPPWKPFRDPARFEVPRVGPEDDDQIPAIFRDLSVEEKRGITAAYYTSTEWMD